MDQDFIYRLFRQALKARQLYPEESPIPREATTRLAAELAARSEIEGVSIAFLEDGAYVAGRRATENQEDGFESMARRLFELGLGELRFLPGIESTELDRLLGLLHRALQGWLNPVDEDLNVLLWESDLSHVAYWFYEDDGWLESDLAEIGRGPSGDPYLPDGLIESPAREERFLSSATQVLGVEGDEVDAPSGPWDRAVGRVPVAYRGLPLAEYLDQEFRDAEGTDVEWTARLGEDERVRIVAGYRREMRIEVPWKYGRLLYECLRVEAEPAESERIRILIEEYLEALSSTGRFALVRSILGSLLPEPEDGSVARRSIALLLERRGAGAFLEAAATALEEAEALEPGEREAALGLFRDAPAAALTTFLTRAGEGRVDAPDLLEVLEARLAGAPELLHRLLHDDERSGRLFGLRTVSSLDGDLARRVRELARSDDLEMKLAALRALARSRDGASVGVLGHALQDPASEVRRAAAAALSTRGGADALEPLLRLVTSKEFSDLSADERRCHLAATGRAAPQEVLPVLARLAEKRPLLPWNAPGELARLALDALAELGPETASFLRDRWRSRRRDLLRGFDERVRRRNGERRSAA